MIKTRQQWVHDCFEALGWQCTAKEMAEWLALRGISMGQHSLHVIRSLVRKMAGKEVSKDGKLGQRTDDAGVFEAPGASSAYDPAALEADLAQLRTIRNSYDDFPVAVSDLHTLKRLKHAYGSKVLLELCGYLDAS